MKKQMILAAIAVTALASCTKTELPSVASFEKEIGFNAVAHKSTKADGKIVTNAVFPLDNTFTVWGFSSDAEDFSEFTTTSASNFMTGLKIEWTGGRDSRTEAWRNADNYYYWPSKGLIGFYAVAPSAVAPTTATFGGFEIADYTLEEANKTTDLMYGYAEGQNRTTALPLTFSHALAQVSFVVKTKEDYSLDATFTVDSVKIKNVDLSGDFAFSFKPDTTAAWTDNTTLVETLVICDTATVATKNGVQVAEPLVVIPQTVGSTSKIEVGYTIEQADGSTQSGVITVDIPTTVSEVVDAAATWEMGKKYNYTLNFKLNEIIFSPDVKEWVDVNVDEITLP